MWERETFDTDLYHLVGAFIVYSMLGWLVESIYMSFCNRKITNRGFGKGPFCPIYGVGALVGYIILSPLKGNYLGIYIAGAISATLFEYIVGVMMIRFLGSLWWDYNDKPFNYKGIICLESTVAWGFYALGIVYFLQNAVYGLVDRIHKGMGIMIISAIFMMVFIDYVIQFMKVFDFDFEGQKEKIGERVKSFKSRWS